MAFQFPLALFDTLLFFFVAIWLWCHMATWQRGRLSSIGKFYIYRKYKFTNESLVDITKCWVTNDFLIDLQYVVIVVSLKSGIETKSWCKFTHISIWGSIICWIVFLTAYSYIYAVLPLGSDITGIAYMVFSTPCFYIGLIFVPVVTLLPDILKKV